WRARGAGRADGRAIRRRAARRCECLRARFAFADRLRQAPRAMHHVLRGLAVCVLAFALSGLRHVSVDAPVESLSASASYQRNPERVALQVDGWIIEVDGVAAADELAESAPKEKIAPVAVVRRPRNDAISSWDRLIHRQAAAEGLDWRLV